MTTAEESLIADTADTADTAGRGSSQTRVRSRVLFLAVLAAAMLLGLVYPFPVGGRMWSQIFDLAHAPAFCFLLLVLAGFIDPGSVGLPARFGVLREVRSGETMVLAGGCLILGCAGEFLQAFAGRSPGVADLIANGAGILSGVLWMRSCRHSGRRRLLLAVAAGLVMTSALVRPVLGIRGALQQQTDFPLLASFERASDFGAWSEKHSEMQRTTEWATHGGHALHLRLFPGKYSGVNMVWPPRDWRGYSQLRWDLKNPGSEPLTLVLKIHDKLHRDSGFDPADRYETTVTVPAGGEYALSIDLSDVEAGPESRTLDLRQVAGVELFSVKMSSGATLLLDHMRLTADQSPH